MLNFGMSQDEVRQAAEAYDSLLDRFRPYGSPFTTITMWQSIGRNHFDGKLRPDVREIVGRDLTEDELLQLVAGTYSVFGGSVRINGLRFSGYIDSI